MVGGLYVLQGIEGSSEAVSSGVSGGWCIACSVVEAEGADDDLVISVEGSRWLCHIHWTHWLSSVSQKHGNIHQADMHSALFHLYFHV